MVEPEDAMKWYTTRPGRTSLTSNAGDAIVDFAPGP